MGRLDTRKLIIEWEGEHDHLHGSSRPTYRLRLHEDKRPPKGSPGDPDPLNGPGIATCGNFGPVITGGPRSAGPRTEYFLSRAFPERPRDGLSGIVSNP
jgi:hypothetical protein